jgi:hypothetical protein
MAGGKPAVAQYRRCQELCRTHSPEPAKAIIKMEEETDDERVRFTCAAWIYERAWGKPKDYDPSLEKGAGGIFDLAKLPREQLRMLLELTRTGAVRPADGDNADDVAVVAGEP